MNPESEVPQDADRRPDPATDQPPSHSARRGVFFLLLIALAVAGYFYWTKGGGSSASATTDPKVGKKGGGGGIPVVGARARRGDIGIYLPGTGNVTPIYTVTVKSRVDGQLMSVRYKEGDMVNKDDLLIEIDPRPYQAAVTQAEGNLARDQALLANAHTDLARYELLVPQKAVPEQMLATQRALVQQYEGVVKNDEGVLDAAKVNLVYCNITAPITGLVGLRLVDPGNIVHATDTNGMLVITQIDPISVIFTLAEDQLQSVLQKQRAGVKLEVDAWDRGLTKRLAQGTLTTIDNEIDQTTGTVRLRATFDNKDRELFPSQFVNAKLLLEEKHGVVLVNTAAVQRNSNVVFVWVVQPDSTASVRKVQEGIKEGDDEEIVSGLKPGEVVVLTGIDKLQEGSKVTVQIPGEKPGGKGK